MEPRQKPDHIRLVGGNIDDTEFETAGQRAAAQDILQLYPKTHNLREISDRTQWSHSHIRNVFREYFEPDEGDTTRVGDVEIEVIEELRDLNVAEMTPIDSLTKLQELQDRLTGK